MREANLESFVDLGSFSASSFSLSMGKAPVAQAQRAQDIILIGSRSNTRSSH